MAGVGLHSPLKPLRQYHCFTCATYAQPPLSNGPPLEWDNRPASALGQPPSRRLERLTYEAKVGA